MSRVSRVNALNLGKRNLPREPTPVRSVMCHIGDGSPRIPEILVPFLIQRAFDARVTLIVRVNPVTTELV